MSVEAIIRGAIRGGLTGNRVEASFNGIGDLLAAQGAPDYTEVTRKGLGYATMATGAVAALVVRPTTTAALEIYNNSPTHSLVVDRLFSHNLVGVANSAFGIYAMVTTVKAAPTDAALAINSLSGKPIPTKSVFTAASTTVVDNGWFPYGPFGSNVTVTTPGPTLEAIIAGRLIVPPSCSLCLHVVASTTGATFTSGAAWYAMRLDLE